MFFSTFLCFCPSQDLQSLCKWPNRAERVLAFVDVVQLTSQSDWLQTDSFRSIGKSFTAFATALQFHWFLLNSTKGGHAVASNKQFWQVTLGWPDVCHEPFKWWALSWLSQSSNRTLSFQNCHIITEIEVGSKCAQIPPAQYTVRDFSIFQEIFDFFFFSSELTNEPFRWNILCKLLWKFEVDDRTSDNIDVKCCFPSVTGSSWIGVFFEACLFVDTVVLYLVWHSC